MSVAVAPRMRILEYLPMPFLAPGDNGNGDAQRQRGRRGRAAQGGKQLPRKSARPNLGAACSSLGPYLENSEGT